MEPTVGEPTVAAEPELAEPELAEPEHAEPEAAEAEVEAPPAEVWVLAGRPRFHREDCMIVRGQNAQPMPLDQAVAEGLRPCSLCEAGGR
jgi:hypothetical protein